MIWYEQDIRCRNNPSNYHLKLTGVFNHPQYVRSKDDIIQIILEINSDAGHTSKRILYSKNPSFLKMPEEYIDPDMVLSKYIHNIKKIEQKIEKSEMEELLRDA